MRGPLMLGGRDFLCARIVRYECDLVDLGRWQQEEGGGVICIELGDSLDICLRIHRMDSGLRSLVWMQG